MNLIPEKSNGGRRGAFTLLELLVVMSIMVLLAGLVLAAMGGMKDQASRKKCKNQIEAIGLGMELFFRDNGEYPINEADPVDDPEAGAAILYQALSGDGNSLLGFYGEPSESTGELGSSHTAYMEQLNPEADPQGMVSEGTATGYYLNDPWREPFRYVRYDDDPPGERQQFQRRPATYDLYSHGQTKESEDQEDDPGEKKWVTNWD